MLSGGVGDDALIEQGAVDGPRIWLGKVHDPMTWNLDVAKRIKAIELGEW